MHPIFRLKVYFNVFTGILCTGESVIIGRIKINAVVHIRGEMGICIFRFLSLWPVIE